MLRRWAVGLLGHLAVREHFVSGAYLRKYLSDSLQILHTAPLGGLVVPFVVYEFFTYFWFRTMTYLDVLTHTSFPEQISKTTGLMQSYCKYMFSKVPSCAIAGFWTLTLKLSQHFDLIYTIGKSD